jgi:hypothetical protein
MPPRETLATASFRPNSESLAVRVVLAHPHVVFHPYTCRLHRGVDAAVVAAVALIGYDDIKVATNTIRREEATVIDYFLYTDTRLRWITAPTLLLLLSVSSSNDP